MSDQGMKNINETHNDEPLTTGQGSNNIDTGVITASISNNQTNFVSSNSTEIKYAPENTGKDNLNTSLNSENNTHSDHYDYPKTNPPPYSYLNIFAAPTIKMGSLVLRSTESSVNPFNITAKYEANQIDRQSRDYIVKLINLHKENDRIIQKRANHLLEMALITVSTKSALSSRTQRCISNDINNYYFNLEETTLTNNGLTVNPSEIDLTLNNNYLEYITMINKNLITICYFYKKIILFMSNYSNSLLDFGPENKEFNDTWVIGGFDFYALASDIDNGIKFELLLAQYFSLISNFYFIVCAFYNFAQPYNDNLPKCADALISIRDTIVLILSSKFSTVSTKLKLQSLFIETPTTCLLETDDENDSDLIPFTYCDPIVDPDTFLNLYLKDEEGNYDFIEGSFLYNLANINERYLPEHLLPEYH